jgi:hypothetical protein
VAAAIRTPADLEHIELAPGQAALWWLGQSGFALRARGTTLLLDPFLSRNPDRLHPPAFAPEQGTGVAAILCSHEHIDHLDAESLPGLAPRRRRRWSWCRPRWCRGSPRWGSSRTG